MPFKSKAQRRKFAQLLVEGKIDEDTFEEWNRETGRQQLPERVDAPGARKATKKSTVKKKRAAKSKRAGAKKRAGVKKRASTSRKSTRTSKAKRK